MSTPASNPTLIINLDVHDGEGVWHLSGELSSSPVSPEELVDALRQEASPYQDYFLLEDPEGRSLIYSVPAAYFTRGSNFSLDRFSANFPMQPETDLRVVDLVDHAPGPVHFTGAAVDFETERARELLPHEEAIREEILRYLSEQFSETTLTAEEYLDATSPLITALDDVALGFIVHFERETGEEGAEGYRIRLVVQAAPASVDLSVLPEDLRAELTQALQEELARVVEEWDDSIVSPPEGSVSISGRVLRDLEQRIAQYLNTQPGVYSFRWVPGWESGAIRLELASAPFPAVRFVEHGPRDAFTELGVDLADLSDQLYSGISLEWSQNDFDAFWETMEQRYREAGFEINLIDAVTVTGDGAIWIDPMRAYQMIPAEAVYFEIPSEALSQVLSVEEITRTVFPAGTALTGSEFSEGLQRVATLIAERGFVLQDAHPSDPTSGRIPIDSLDDTAIRVTFEIAQMGELEVEGYPNGTPEDFIEVTEWQEGEPFRPVAFAERLEIALASYNLALTYLDFYYGTDGRLNARIFVDRTPHFVTASAGAQSNGDAAYPIGGVRVDISHPVEEVSRASVSAQAGLEGIQVAITGQSLPLSPDGPSITGAIEVGHDWDGDWDFVSVVPGIVVPLDRRREWLLSGGVPVTFYGNGGTGWQTSFGGRLRLAYQRRDPLLTQGDRFQAELRLEDRIGGPEGQGIGAAVQYRLPLSDDGQSGFVISGEGRCVEEGYAGNYVILPSTIDFTQGVADLVETGGRAWGTMRVERELGPVTFFGGASVSGSGDGTDLSPGIGIQVPEMGLTIYGGYPLFEDGGFVGGERSPEIGIGYTIRW